MADEAGALSAVHFRGTERQLERPQDSLLMAGTPSRTGDALREAALGERIVDVKALAAASTDGSKASFVRLDAASRQCTLHSVGAKSDEIRLEA